MIAATGVSPTGADLLALSGIASGVSAAIVRMADGNKFERATYTDVILDAPLGEWLTLPQWPVASIASLKLAWNARGDAASFADTPALTAGDDYQLPIDDVVLGLNRRGRVRYLKGPVWAYWLRRPLDMLTARPIPAPGAILTTFTAGYAVLPDDLVQAAVMAANLLYQRRVVGMPATNESWNSYSVGYAGPFSAVSALTSPDVWQLLKNYVPSMNLA